MKQALSSLTIIFVLLIPACFSKSGVFPFLNDTSKCEDSFQEIVKLTESSIISEKVQELTDEDSEKVVYKIVEASEGYLNNCTDPNLPLENQPEKLARLAELSQTIPQSFRCGLRYTPTTQLLDVNRDGVQELILHTQATNCYRTPNVDGSGGLSIIFHKAGEQKWQGHVI
jgi:hypothetical protein